MIEMHDVLRFVQCSKSVLNAICRRASQAGVLLVLTLIQMKANKRG